VRGFNRGTWVVSLFSDGDAKVLNGVG